MSLRSLAPTILVLTVAVATGNTRSISATNTDVTIVRVPNGGLQPELAVDGKGVLHMLYFGDDPTNGNIYYVRSADWGAAFSEPVRVNSQDGSAIARGSIRGAQIAVGRNGRVHVVWNGSGSAEPKGPANPRTNAATAPMLYTRSNVAGTAFEPQRNLITRTFDLDGGGSVAADGEGRVYVAWHGNETGTPAGVPTARSERGKAEEGEGTRRVWLARSTDEGATFSTEAPVWSEATGACGCCGLRVTTSTNGAVYLLYRSARNLVNRDIYSLISNDHGNSFRGARLHPWNIAACPMTSMSFGVSERRVLGSWETDGQVYFRQMAPAVSTPPVSPAGGGGRKHPRLALNPRGETLLVWTEGMSHSHGGSLAWQRFDGQGKPVDTPGAQPGVPALSFAAAFARPDGTYVVVY